MHRRTILTIALAAALALAAGTAAAQAPADSSHAAPADTSHAAPLPVPAPAVSAPPTAASILGPNSPTPSRPHLVAPRAEAVIRAEHDAMTAAANTADSDVLTEKKNLIDAKGTVEIKKREIDTIASRAKAAKQAKDDVTKTAMDGERKRQESMKSFFQLVQDVADAAIDEAQARSDMAKAAVHACDLELSLVGRAGVASYDADPTVFRLEQQWLEAVKAYGSAQEKLANKAQSLADRKLRLYRGWADYLGGK